MFYLMQCVTSGCARVSGQERSYLSVIQLRTLAPFYSPMVSFQRVCDFKGHTSQGWKCHTSHKCLSLLSIM